MSTFYFLLIQSRPVRAVGWNYSGEYVAAGSEDLFISIVTHSEFIC